MRINFPYNSQRESTGRFIKTERLLFAFLLMASLYPLVAFRYLPSVDLANHLLTSALYANVLDNPGNEYLSTKWVASPYILFHILMYPFVKLFGYLVASKIVLGLYVVGLPLSVRWFINVFNPENRVLALLTFPFIYNYHFDYGLMPYVIGIPLVFCGLAVLGRAIKNGFPLRLMLLSSAASILIYLSHFMNFAAYGIGVLILILLCRRSRDRAIETVLPFSSQVTRIALIHSPALVMLFLYAGSMFLSGEMATTTGTLATYGSPYRQFIGAIRFFITKNMIFDSVKVGLFGVLVLALVSFREKIFNRGFLLYFGIAAWAASLLIPRERFIDGWDMSSRVAIFGVISIIGSLVLRRAITRKLVVVIAVVLAIISIAQQTLHTRFTNRLTHSYVETMCSTIPSGSRICTVNNALRDANASYVSHAIAYYHMKHGGYSPFLFSDKPQVSGLDSSLELPRLYELWDSADTVRFKNVLPHYDYLVISTYGEGLPEPFMAMSDGFVHSDSVCTVIDLSKTPYARR